MNDEKIVKFARNYLSTKTDGFIAQIFPPERLLGDDNRSLTRLIRNPYLLSALIFVYDKTPDGQLPRNNGALMKTLSKVLWERERLKQTIGWVPFDVMEEEFSDVAFVMIDNEMPIDVSIQYVMARLGSPDLLTAGHSANLLEIRGTEVRFYHQLMQEYFAAVRLGKNIRAPRYVLKWDQVFVALSGIVENPDNLVRQIADMSPFIATDCILNGAKVSQNVKKEIADKLGQVECGEKTGQI